jgi:hypothetical protein
MARETLSYFLISESNLLFLGLRTWSATPLLSQSFDRSSTLLLWRGSLAR